MKEIFGVTHPIPKWFAERIYNEDKTVFISKSHRGKVSKGDKFVIYESRGAGAYTGWADIISVEKVDRREILKKYKKDLMITENEFKKYSFGRKDMNIIVFENFEKFKKPVVPKRFVAVSGKYIDEKEYKMITKNKN